MEGRLARKSALGRASREDTTEATLVLFGAENKTEAGKAGNRIKLRIGCRLQAAVANSVYLRLYHSGPRNSPDPPTAISQLLAEIVEIKTLRLAFFIMCNYQIRKGLGL